MSREEYFQTYFNNKVQSRQKYYHKIQIYPILNIVRRQNNQNRVLLLKSRASKGKNVIVP